MDPRAQEAEALLRDLLVLFTEPYAGSPVPVAIKLIEEYFAKQDART